MTHLITLTSIGVIMFGSYLASLYPVFFGMLILWGVILILFHLFYALIYGIVNLIKTDSDEYLRWEIIFPHLSKRTYINVYYWFKDKRTARRIKKAVKKNSE